MAILGTFLVFLQLLKSIVHNLCWLDIVTKQILNQENVNIVKSVAHSVCTVSHRKHYENTLLWPKFGAVRQLLTPEWSTVNCWEYLSPLFYHSCIELYSVKTNSDEINFPIFVVSVQLCQLYAKYESWFW